MDDWSGLENRRGVTAAAGSNPAPSAMNTRKRYPVHMHRVFLWSLQFGKEGHNGQS